MRRSILSIHSLFGILLRELAEFQSHKEKYSASIDLTHSRDQARHLPAQDRNVRSHALVLVDRHGANHSCLGGRTACPDMPTFLTFWPVLV